MRGSILIVDDEPHAVNALADALEDDFEILTATSPDEALKIVHKRHDLAVVIADQRMPHMPGHEFLSRVRQRSSATRLLVTGYADLNAVIKAVNEGQIFGYISKPWDTEDLRFLVMKAAEHHDLEQGIREERDLLHNLMNNVPDAIYFMDKRHRYSRLNNVQARMLGVSRTSEALGKTARDFMPEEEVGMFEGVEREVLKQGKAIADRLISRGTNGGQRWFSLTNAPIRDQHDAITGLVAILRDVTERRRTEEALVEREAALRHAEHLARLGHRIWIAEKGVFARWSPALLDVCKMSPASVPQTLDDWLQVVHPHDRQRVAGTFRHLSQDAGVQRFEYRVLRRGADSIIVDEILEPISSVGANEDRCWFSTLKDVTESRRYDREIELLLGITQAMTGAESFDQALAAGLRVICEGAGWDYGEAWLPDPTHGELRLSSGWYGASRAARRFRAAAREMGKLDPESFPGRVWKARKPVYLGKLSLPSASVFRRSEAAAAAGLATAVGVPVTDSSGNVLAVLVFLASEESGGDKLIDVVAGAVRHLSVTVERILSTQALRESEQRLRSIAANVPGVIYRFVIYPDGTDNLEYISQGCERLYGISPAEAQRDPYLLHRMVHPEDREQYDIELQQVMAANSIWSNEYRIIARDGAVHWLTERAIPYRRDDGAVEWIGVILDVSERRQAEEQLHYLAQYDPATRLPNRTLMVDRIRHAVLQAERDRELVGVIELHLDQYQMISESLGGKATETLVVQVAERLSAVLDETDTLARLGPGDFGVIATGYCQLGELDGVLQRTRLAFDTPFKVEDHNIHLTTTLGIAVFPNDSDDAEVLLRAAGIAAHRARVRGKDSVQFYTSDMNAQALRRLSLDQRLRQALARDEFEVFYQPQVDARHGQIVGCEALVRWRDGSGNYVSPAEFVPVAEESGLIVPLGETIMRRVCNDLKTWREIGLQVPSVAVNVSAKQFSHSGLVTDIRTMLEQADIPPEMVKLEVTESTLMMDFEEALGVLGQLRDQGLGVAIDDFGTGYSSLNYLRRLPVKTLKIDQSFIRQMTGDTKNAAIVETIIRLAHGLDMNVVAEGVETAEQLTYLRAYACDYVQGYLYYRPMSGEQFVSRLLQ